MRTSNIVSPRAFEQNRIILDLKQKLHNSFIEHAQRQRFYQEQLDNCKEFYEQKLQQIDTKNRFLENKIKKLEDDRRGFNEFDIGQLEESLVMSKRTASHTSFHAYDKSFLDLMINNQVRTKIEQLQELQKCLKLNKIKLSPMMIQYIQVANQMSKQLLECKSSLNSMKEYSQRLQTKCQKIEIMYQSLSRSQQKLKQDNMKLAQLYKQQLNKNASIKYGQNKTTGFMKMSQIRGQTKYQSKNQQKISINPQSPTKNLDKFISPPSSPTFKIKQFKQKRFGGQIPYFYKTSLKKATSS